MTEKQSDHASGEATANITYALRANFFEPDAPTTARAQCADSGIHELPSGSALLVVKRGPNAGSRFVLDQPVMSVGRHPNSDIFCDDNTVSRRPTRRIPPPHGAARHCLAPIVGLPLDIPVTGRIAGKPWRQAIDYANSRVLACYPSAHLVEPGKPRPNTRHFAVTAAVSPWGGRRDQMAIKSARWQTITEAPPKKVNAITPGKRLESSNEGKRQLTRKPS